MADKAEIIFEKYAAIPGWGGMHSTIGSKKSPVNLQIGYSYGLGVIPLPLLGVRLGKRGKVGVTIGSVLGIDSGVPLTAKFVGSSPRSVWKIIKDKWSKRNE